MSRSVRLAAKANSLAVCAAATDEQLRQASLLLRKAEEAGAHGTTWLQIGRAYLELGDFVSSNRAFERAREQLKKNPALELFSAILALDERDIEKAQSHLEALKQICPDNQALSTAQALCFLLQKRPEEALQLLRSRRAKDDSFDITVSPLLISRLAAVVEETVLPCELPPRELIDQPAGESPHEATPTDHESPKEAAPTGGESPSEAVPTDGKSPSETAPAGGESPSETVPAGGESPSETAPAGNESPKEAHSEVPAQSSASAAKQEGIADPKAFAQELKRLLPPLPPGVSVGGFSLKRGGTERLQRSWELPIPERIEQFTIAVHELLHSYERSPKAYQAAFCLAEGLLALAEYGRERSERYGSQQMLLVRQAEILLREALICDKDIAFASHYLARTQLLQYRFAEAEKLWRQALAEFEKLPEAQYGLGQALIMSGKLREGRLHIAQAVNADMRLLRERLSDLRQISGKPTQT